MFSYLQNRRGNYQVRVRVPRDLSSVIPQADIIKSLKTRDRKTARDSALPYLQIISQTFSLIRSHFITPEQVQERLYSLLGKAKEVQPHGTTEAPAVVGVNISTIASHGLLFWSIPDILNSSFTLMSHSSEIICLVLP